MQRIFLTTVIIILVILTLVIGVKQPDMHKKLFVYNSDFEITEQEQTKKEETQNIPTQVNTVQTQNRYEQKIKTIKDEPEITTKSEQVKNTINPVTKNQTTIKQIPQKTTSSQKQSTVQKQMSIPEKQTKSEVKTTTPAKAVKQEQTQTPVKTQTLPDVKKENTIVQKSTEPKELTEEEEVILWNKWRSDLQNKIMNDVKLPSIQEGIIFKFSFDVDKYGKINNVKTWSTTPEYTPYAIQYIAPVIRSYQGKEILNFPQGSKRYTTTAQGAWKISKTAKYSTPQDYSDTEKITN